MNIPSQPISLMSQVYVKILPKVHRELTYWKKRAREIPDDELRKQALLSIKYKTFHCEGGAILAILAKENREEAIRFIVAYQTISDYLDNLCDRSTSLDPADFQALHEAMSDALTIDAPKKDYYRFRQEEGDGHYLEELVETCQRILKDVKNYDVIQPYIEELCGYYCDLQIHKHVLVEERVTRLKKWFSMNENKVPKNMSWYEFSACSGSTLGIFVLLSYAMREEMSRETAAHMYESYFPYIQGLHILLDYFIDQEEDVAGGDLNFCFYYKNEQHLFERLTYFVKEAGRHTRGLPDEKFHQLLQHGLLGVYLSDNKVKKQKDVHYLAKRLIKLGGKPSCFFYMNGRIYRRVQKIISSVR